jgi:hypothetical protein
MYGLWRKLYSLRQNVRKSASDVTEPNSSERKKQALQEVDHNKPHCDVTLTQHGYKTYRDASRTSRMGIEIPGAPSFLEERRAKTASHF